MAIDTSKKESVSILNVGSKILEKDLMEQYIRSLGHYSDFKTHYASNLASAMRSLTEKKINIIIAEIEYDDGSFFRMMKNLNWSPEASDLYMILAVEDKKKEYQAFADECEIHSVMVKPFTAASLKAELDKFMAWKALPKQPWQLLVADSVKAYAERRYTDVDSNFKQAVMSAPDNPLPFLRAGIYYMTEKVDYPVSETLLKKAYELKPTLAQTLSALGQLYLRKRDFEKSDDFYKKAQAISSINPDRMVEMVKLHIEWSIDLCRTALRVDPGSIMAKMNLGKLLAYQRDYIGAVRELEPIVHQVPADRKLETQTFAALSRKLGGLQKS